MTGQLFFDGINTILPIPPGDVITRDVNDALGLIELSAVLTGEAFENESFCTAEEDGATFSKILRSEV